MKASAWGPDDGPGNIWQGIRPGDVFFTGGGGLVGAAIRYGTHSPHAHCGVFIEQLDDADDPLWLTHEAFPRGDWWRPWTYLTRPGLAVEQRRASTVTRVYPVWRTRREQARIIGASLRLVRGGTRYAYGEILRIILWRLLRLYPGGDNPQTAICSNHVAQAVTAGRPDVAHPADRPPGVPASPSGHLTRPAAGIWPGRLERDLGLIVHNDVVADRRDRTDVWPAPADPYLD